MEQFFSGRGKTIHGLLTKGEDRLLWFGLIAIVALGGYLRLAGLDQVGIGGNDTIYYYTLAERWSEGDFAFAIGDGIPIHRPLLLAYNSFALTVFGYSDFALKMANALLDTLNILLVARLAWLASRQALVVVASSACYALMPMAIWASRVELPHVLSTSLVLLGAVAVSQAILASDYRVRSLLSLAAGAFVGLAALTHEELIVLAAPFSLALLVDSAIVRAETARSYLLAFLLSNIVPLALLAAVAIAKWNSVSSLVGTAESTILESFNYHEVLARNIAVAFLGSTSGLLSMILALALLSTVVKEVLAEPSSSAPTAANSKALVFWFLVCAPFIFLALFSIFVPHVFPRNFLPLVPLALVSIFCSVQRVFQSSFVARAVLITLGCTAIVFANLASFTDYRVANRKYGQEWPEFEWPSAANLNRSISSLKVAANFETATYYNHWRNIHTALKGFVNEQNRLLVNPSTVFYAPGRRALQTNAYFGDDAIFRLDHLDATLPELVQAKQIRYVLWTTGQLRAAPTLMSRYEYGGKWSDPQKVDLGAALELGEYSVEGEGAVLAKFLRLTGAREMQVFPPDTYEAVHARVFRLP